MVFSGRITPEYNGNDKPARTAREEGLEDPGVPEVLKHLALHLIPEKRSDELAALVREGSLDPLMICEARPLLSPLSQVMGMPREEADRWLKIMLGDDPEKWASAQCPCYGFRNGRFSTDPDYKDSYYNMTLETPALLAVLAARTETPVVDIAQISPAALALPAADRYGNATDQPLLHQMLQTKEFSIATFDKLEKITGGTDFLFIKNARGETLFHRLASAPSFQEDLARLDAVSWMLQRRPGLVNEPDRFGWTPLDRLLSQSQGKVDTSMGRLLIVSGARLEKQMATQFNLAAALEERSGARLDKPGPRKTSVISKNL
ncbi:MAG: hypothetical protein EPN97_05560 [Alphaproteobacteria bacterium]|nr:MAG: hypothetical protein EPN97_05560 [Alphaproteobacteria bacterium]